MLKDISVIYVHDFHSHGARSKQIKMADRKENIFTKSLKIDLQNIDFGCVLEKMLHVVYELIKLCILAREVLNYLKEETDT